MLFMMKTWEYCVYTVNVEANVTLACVVVNMLSIHNIIHYIMM